MAAARGRRDRDLEARLRAYFGPDITRAHLKMADAPTGAIQRMLHPCFCPARTLEVVLDDMPLLMRPHVSTVRVWRRSQTACRQVAAS